jgi:hypothetical protein
MENIVICHLEQNNIHGQIFGRFFMEQTFELTFLTCYMFGGITPLFLEVVHVMIGKYVLCLRTYHKFKMFFFLCTLI